MDQKGTPASLLEAIQNGSGDPKKIELHVIDFLAQKFAMAILTGNESEERALADLWEKTTGRPCVIGGKVAA